MEDLTALNDEDLDTLRIDVLAEQERRARLATAADVVAETTRRYIADGGDKADLVTAVESADAAKA